MKFNGFSKLALALALTATQVLAQAGTISFNTSACDSGPGASNKFTCTKNVSGVNYSATMSAWSAQSGNDFAKATMVYYSNSGIGITSPRESTVSPNHAMDNNGATEAILVNFNSSNFALNQLTIGWMYGDADVSILRYTGTQAPDMGSRTVADLKNAAGWDWVGDYSTMTTSGPLNFNNTGTAKTAAWWLISAYDAGYSGKAPTGGLTSGNDYFKLSGFGGSIVVPPTTTTTVPEPGTFALSAIALLGFAAARRKSKAK
jgi:hypothetical protein